MAPKLLFNSSFLAILVTSGLSGLLLSISSETVDLTAVVITSPSFRGYSKIPLNWYHCEKNPAFILIKNYVEDGLVPAKHQFGQLGSAHLEANQR